MIFVFFCNLSHQYHSIYQHHHHNNDFNHFCNHQHHNLVLSYKLWGKSWFVWIRGPKFAEWWSRWFGQWLKEHILSSIAVFPISLIKDPSPISSQKYPFNLKHQPVKLSSSKHSFCFHTVSLSYEKRIYI